MKGTHRLAQPLVCHILLCFALWGARGFLCNRYRPINPWNFSKNVQQNITNKGMRNTVDIYPYLYLPSFPWTFHLTDDFIPNGEKNPMRGGCASTFCQYSDAAPATLAAWLSLWACMLLQCGPLIWSKTTWSFRSYGQFLTSHNQHQLY